MPVSAPKLVNSEPLEPGCEMQLLAKDGVYLPSAPRILTYGQGLLASGNRADLLIKCPPGDFTFLSTVLPAPGKQTGAVNGTIMHIKVDPLTGGAIPQCDLPVFEVNRPCCG